ncbi:hypothetical protein DICPUDRAFT_85335 [Dictyostelium purpureum]|uniref:Uncharacterized protein n=1 Tax=Dictyostelium purpureum TaxID=5786 RepID=F1A5E7_DICPU|nr:uncharacterized protein DICPUDRAFT_85335 [Dictyostelium purpureum]EGC28583.1 hypothetical protein DICPUDRAFT_85335 [Dictyostelium purpureum]|eukprot:XP_003294890.1 hypothetical protein DICPUDRAFT_85335 [Dictyostelium purpureum]
MDEILSKPEAETSFTNDFKQSLKKFGVSEQGIDLLENDEYLFKRIVTREEIDKQNAFLLKQGDYFTKSIELEEENILLKEKIEALQRELQQKNDTIIKLNKELHQYQQNK